MTELKSALGSISASEIAEVLANCFGKEKSDAQAAINKLKEKIKPDDLTSVEGLAKIWVQFSTALSKQERGLNIAKIEGIIKESVKRIQGKEEDFLQAVVERTRKNLEQIYTHSKERLF